MFPLFSNFRCYVEVGKPNRYQFHWKTHLPSKLLAKTIISLRALEAYYKAYLIRRQVYTLQHVRLKSRTDKHAHNMHMKNQGIMEVLEIFEWEY